MKEKGEIKTKRIRKFKSKDHKNKMERCKTKRKSPQYVPQNLAEHDLKLIFIWYTQNFMQHVRLSREISCKF